MMDEKERLEYAEAYAEFLDKCEPIKEVESLVTKVFFEGYFKGWSAGMKQATQAIKDEVLRK